MKLVIRTAIVSDVDIILDLLYELERPRPTNKSDLQIFKDIILQYITGKDKTLIVAEYDKLVVGLSSIMFLLRCNQKQMEMYIPELIIRHQYQKCGIGKMLIKHCVSLAREKNCYRIRLESGNWRKIRICFTNTWVFHNLHCRMIF